MSSLILISTSNSDSFLSASVLAERTSFAGLTYCGKSRKWRDAEERNQEETETISKLAIKKMADTDT